MPEDLFGDRLLVIDDEPALGTIIKRVAQGCGFEVVVTQDASLFMNTARLWHPTVIMLDLKMPGTDGVQLLRTLAADKCSARVVVSSGADTKVLESAMMLGRERGLNMCQALQKPIRVEALRERLFGFKRISKLQLSADLSKAISTNQLFLEYQPKLNCSTRQISSVEALVRWKHPNQGIIPPDKFIALAEEIGVIDRLTDWVMAEATTQAGRWQAADHPIEVAVNISARDIEDIDLPDRMEKHCIDAGIDPEMMTLELTETGAMREAVQMMDVLTRLRIKGFKLSIDDFGTGYSSLVQLQRMPFSELKIDQSFTMQMMTNDGSRVIVEIIIDLAKKLGLTSVAEGVEDEATLNALIELGCNKVQGYFVSRPIAANLVADFKTEYQATRGRAAA